MCLLANSLRLKQVYDRVTSCNPRTACATTRTLTKSGEQDKIEREVLRVDAKAGGSGQFAVRGRVKGKGRASGFTLHRLLKDSIREVRLSLAASLT